MKKVIYIIALMALCINISSCSEWLDINTNPNAPSTSDITASLVFPSAQNYIAEAVGDVPFNYSAIFCQYLDQAPEANQYNAYCEYNFIPTDGWGDATYSAIYAGALEDIEQVKKLTTNKSDLFAATVLRAYCFQVMSDQMEKLPYTEALLGSENPNPKWDEGKDIYAGVLAEIDAAEAECSGEPMSMKDLMLDSDIDQWIGFANALRLRMLMRTSNVENNSAKIQALVNDDNFFTGNVEYGPFSDESAKRNPWYEGNKIDLGTNNHVAAMPFVNYLQFTNDPRIAWFFEKAKKSNEYAGQVPGSKQQSYASAIKNQDMSLYNFNGKALQPVSIFSQAELNFLKAEAYLRFFNDEAKAKEAYEAAVKSAFDALGVAGADEFLQGSNANFDSASDKLKLIYLQKWVGLAMQNNTEAWAEVRRTGVPALCGKSAKEVFEDNTLLTPGTLVTPGNNPYNVPFIQRMPYPNSASRYNVNTPKLGTAESLGQKIWWAK